MNEDDKELIQDTARRLRQARRTAKLTQVQVALKAGISENHYAQIERGEKNPTTSNFRKILQAIGITPKELFDE